MNPSSFSITRAVPAGVDCDAAYGAVIPPLHLSTNFSFTGLGGKRRYDYTRTANPTRDLLGEALAELEGGVGASVTSSGMSAVALVLQLIPPGGRILATHDLYGGTHRLFTAWAKRGRFSVEFADLTDAAALERGLAEKPALVWIETPSNPLLRITDIAAVTAGARRAGALSLVDNTFLSPALQQPIALGADLVLHSTTKYVNGHSDIVGGAVIAKDPTVAAELAWWANCLGLTGAPFDSFLALRGLRTLDARLRVHLENAEAVAEALCRHPAVERVYYPGLAAHPGHELACRQQSGFGAMVSFEIAGGEPALQALVASLRCFTLAESLGAVESLVAHPASMTHASMEPAARERAGIRDNLVRLSVGIESAADLVADLEKALDAAAVANAASIESTPTLEHSIP